MIQVSASDTPCPDSCTMHFSSILYDWLEQQNVIDQRHYWLTMIQVHLWSLSNIIHTTADFLGNHVVADEDTSQIKQPLCILIRSSWKLTLHSPFLWLHIETAMLKANPSKKTLIGTITRSAFIPKSLCKKSRLWYRINTMAKEKKCLNVQRLL